MAFLILPASLTTPLMAVNAMIASLGEAGVDTLDPPPHEDAVDALAALNAVDLEVQSEGWSWNREHNYPLTLDGSFKAPLPSQTLFAKPAASEYMYSEVVQRGGFLYNPDTRLSTFARAPVVDLIVRLEWDSTPQPFRAYVTLLATQRFHAAKQGANVVLQVNAQDVKRALVTLQQRETEAENLNTLNAVGPLSALQGNGGMRRGRQGLR